MKKIVMVTLLAWIGVCPLSAQASADRALDLSGYQAEDGAITVRYKGDTVDPYFATKALLLARDGGMDITLPGQAWVTWALAMQGKDGRFSRYCNKHEHWETCASADADDAVLALWLELLYAMAPNKGLPKAWQASAHAAQAQLDALYDAKNGIYNISDKMSVGLLMDNIEIYWAYTAISYDAARFGHAGEAMEWRRKAAQLAQHVRAVFWDEEARRFRVSTQARSEDVFYPDQVAQVFVWLYKMPLPDGITPSASWRLWLKDNEETWLNVNEDDYPWGLVASTAIGMDDADTASCWKQRAEPLRYSDRWNVLEEAAFQQVGWRLKFTPPHAAIPCVKV